MVTETVTETVTEMVPERRANGRRSTARVVAVFLATVLGLAACASSSEPAAESAGAPSDADAAAEGDTFTRTSTDDTATTGTTDESIAEGLIAPPHPELPVSITEINFEAGTITITNHGADDVDLGDVWVCEFPDYEQLDALVLAGGASATIPNPHESVPGDGELALYRSNTFGDADEILSYVEWGSAGHTRSAVADEAGVWRGGPADPGQVIGTDGDFVVDADGWSILTSLTGEVVTAPRSTRPAPSSAPPSASPASTSPASTSPGAPPTAPPPPPDDYGPASTQPATSAPAAPPPPDEY